MPRCDCGAEAAHEHLLARDRRGGALSSILGGNVLSLNGFIKSDAVKAWNCIVVSNASADDRTVPTHSIFTSKEKLLFQSVGEGALGTAGTHNESLFAALQRDASSGNQPQDDAAAPVASAVTQQQSVAPAPPPRRASSSAAETYITLRSDADQELLVYCPFTEVLNVRALMITCHPSTPPAEEPSLVSLFVNRHEAHLGFADARRAQHAQQLRLGSLAVPGDAIVYMLDPGKFRSVSSMTFFFKSSFGGRVTQVSRVVCFGESTREPASRPFIATGVVSELMADPKIHVRRLEQEGNTNSNRA